MAETSTTRRDPETLIRALHDSRRAIARDATAFRDRVHPGKRFREAVQKRSAAWVGGALATGFVLAKLSKWVPRPRPKPSKSSTTTPESVAPRGIALFSILMAVLKWVLPFAKPMLMSLLTERLHQLADRLQQEPSKPSTPKPSRPAGRS